MPLVKTTFALVSNDSSLIEPDRHSAVLVALCRQIGELALCCDLLFGELVAEVNKISSRTQSLVERTLRLAVKVDSLDDESTTLPVGGLVADKTLVRRCSVTDYKSRFRRSLFTPSSRPDTIRADYEQCVTSPVEVIAQCDLYRTDGRRGAVIFSPPVFCLREQRTDDFLTVSRPAITKRQQTLGRSIKSLRPSNRTRPTSLPLMSSSLLPFDDHVISEHDTCDDVTSLSFEPETVCIDITGSNFCRQMAMSCNPIIEHPHEEDVVTEIVRDRKCISSWRRTICDVSDLVFNEVDADPPVKDFRKKTRALSVSMSRSMMDRSTLKQSKMSSKRSSCSWKQSLRSLIRGVRTKSTDLWATSQTDSSSDYEQVSTFQRSSSLPRSLKYKVNEVNEDSRFKSKSIEGHLDVSRPEVLDTPSATLSRSRVSLATKSRGRPKSMEVRIMSLDEYGKPFIAERTNNDMVHINLPEQPWTKPFANVKLRLRAVRADSEKYQSSSGHWSGEHSFEGETEPISMTSCHARDSAVSLSCDVTDRVTLSAVKTASEDCLTMKASSSNGTLTDLLDCPTSSETIVIQSPLTSVFHPPVSSALLSSFRRKRIPVETDTGKPELHIDSISSPCQSIDPTPPVRYSSFPMISLLTLNHSAKSSELEKLATLAKKMAAHKSSDNTVTVAELANGSTSRNLLQFHTLPPTIDVSSENVVTKATVTSQVVYKKVTSLTRSGSRDVTLSLISEGSDETDESASCSETMTSSTWPRHHTPTMTSSSSERTTKTIIESESVTSQVGTPNAVSMTVESTGTPTAVSARLIISSPVASRASFVDNPHRRAMCQPLSRDIEATPTCDDPELSVIPPRSVVSSCVATGFPVSIMSATIPSNYGRSWYDGVEETVSDRCNNNNNNNSNSITDSVFSSKYSCTGSSLSRHVTDVDTKSISSQESSITSSSSSDKPQAVAPLTELSSQVSQHLDKLIGIASRQQKIVPAKRRASTSGSFAVHSVKQHKARGVKTRRSISGSERVSTYNVLAATNSRTSSFKERVTSA